ncbi:DNA topoisomerase IV subunit B [Entomobacter blattae]|uniref:DNA topoisomerase (ATP-hydrolyzing) n=1 Tax=Entomobacter blattae TaxID=2762277 RepID=A0A7H1NUQ0_9PROT|nr:DNA topoisomerase IV subunit B [Entomobacter blattae]QNT79510.1 DNA gyrase subunit B [Entomobacter blattae]
MNDLFSSPPPKKTPTQSYTAADIEVLEGLEPVRKRPGMYIGGTDENAYHHLASEILDNAMDEVVAGHASSIRVTLHSPTCISVEDNGRGIPIDPHPKFPDLTALEVILTTLHSGGKFSGKNYATSGGLHGVGLSVVNALSSHLEVEVFRSGTRARQSYEKGQPVSKPQFTSVAKAKHGSKIEFTPDSTIFNKLHFSAKRLYRLCRSKAFLFKGVTIEWQCHISALGNDTDIPLQATLHFPGGLVDSLRDELQQDNKDLLISDLWAEDSALTSLAPSAKAEWAVAWLAEPSSSFSSFCNTIPTPLGGTHENGFKSALVKGFRAWGEQRNQKKASSITADDIFGCSAVKLSVFIPEPQFQGQTKEKLSSPEITRVIEQAVRDQCDHYLTQNPQQADQILAFILDRTEERLKARDQKLIPRKNATKRLRLPGKLTDCTSEHPAKTEIFLVEGDSAGGSAKQARNRETQAILPLRGKILNVASATPEKLKANQELQDLVEALGCGIGSHFKIENLRYHRIIIMTDADVDGAHIASLLMTFFYRELPELIYHGHIYLAQPPLYRLSQKNKILYAMSDEDKDKKIKTEFKNGAKIEVSRFKGLGEMPAIDLKNTTMAPQTRILLKVVVEDDANTQARVDQLMGKKPELRFQFIQEHADSFDRLDI